jgi:hypothetical protein
MGTVVGTVTMTGSNLSQVNTVTSGAVTGPSSINIVGTVWTPNRVSGNVISADFINLPVNTSLEVAGTSLNSVIEIPHLVNGYSSDSSIGIFAYSGAVYDTYNKRMLIHGGGHGDANPLENGIYAASYATMNFSRIVDRSPSTAYQIYDSSNNTFITTPGNPSYNAPLLDGRPASIHSYYSDVYLPPNVMGNTNGGFFIGGYARSVVNLDNNSFSISHWNALNSADAYYSGRDWSNATSMLDGSVIFMPVSSWFFDKFQPLGFTEATSWASNSQGKMTSSYASTVSTPFQHGDSSLVIKMPGRREIASMWPDTTSSIMVNRLRLGSAVDSASTNWEPYMDTITLTSSDGSHNDFTAANLSNINALTYSGTSNLTNAGCVYDSDLDCLWLMANQVGGSLYKITGLNGTTWTTQYISGVTSLYNGKANGQGVYGRMTLETMYGSKILMRVTSRDDPIQIVRLS